MCLGCRLIRSLVGSGGAVGRLFGWAQGCPLAGRVGRVPRERGISSREALVGGLGELFIYIMIQCI